MGMDRSVLRSIPLFAAMDDGQLDRMTAQASARRIPQGESVFEQGDAAKAFYLLLHGRLKVTQVTRDGQQMIVDVARQYSAHKQTVEKPGVRKISEIKLMKEDPEGVEKGADDIKKRYAQIFKV